MIESRATAIVETLRGRILRGLQAGAIAPGDRLQSARELVGEFDADHRLILAAYKHLADQGLVTIRGRGGVYVASTPTIRSGFPTLPVPWLVGMLTEGFAQEIAAPDLHEWLRRVTETLPLRAAVIATTRDQVTGLASELRHDFGLLADAFLGAELGGAATSYPSALRHADIIIATTSQREVASAIAAEFQRPLLVMHIRPALVAGEWALFLRHPMWAIVDDVEFGEMLLEYFAAVPGRENLRILVLGRDDLSSIPEGAPTFVSHVVREKIGDVRIRGRVLPPSRFIATESARELFDFIVRANLDAMFAGPQVLVGASAT